uniref:Reverse transcriptase domain-containing protein n=1 Tax=Tanacetum cinerariifolium TaxID=118510 RepID=A0A6L2J2N0_TANCI|nr:hypothetical protein [Tanacetum cinerariifolium]
MYSSSSSCFPAISKSPHSPEILQPPPLSHQPMTPSHVLSLLTRTQRQPRWENDPGKLGTALDLIERLSLPDLTPTCMTLELAGHSISRLVGVAEDVYFKVGSFHFSADFVVVDFDADPRVPLILGRSFLKTGRALIDGFKGELTLRVGKEAITFNLDQTSLYSANYNNMTAKRIDVIDMAREENSQEVLGFSDTILSVVELKALPPHLEYAFLKGDDKLPIIIAKDLSVEEKTALLTVLKSHKRAIAWKLSDIKGINPEFCTHKILMEEDFTPAFQQQRRVNPKIHEVIKQEGGFIVVENEDNELILARLVTGTFQRCMMVIFHDMIEKTMEVFMDEFSVFENFFQGDVIPVESKFFNDVKHYFWDDPW